MTQETKEETTKEMTKEAAPGRGTRFLRRLVSAGILVLVIAVLVAAPMTLLLYRPMAARATAAEAALEAAEAELGELRPLVSENRELRDELDRSQTLGLALRALVLVNDARVAIALGDSASARMPILEADGVLAGLEGRVPAEQSQVVTGMRDRLALARGEFETDAFAAQRDLEVLGNDLSQLVKELGS